MDGPVRLFDRALMKLTGWSNGCGARARVGLRHVDCEAYEFAAANDVTKIACAEVGVEVLVA